MKSETELIVDDKINSVFHNRDDVDPIVRRFEDLFDKAHKLGSGAYGTVFRARAKRNIGSLREGQEYAVKCMNKATFKVKSVIREMDIMKELKDECKNGFICYESLYFLTRGDKNSQIFPTLVMQLIQGETLLQFIENSGEKISANRFLGIAKDLMNTLALVHKYGYAHRDIKPDNIMMTKEGHPVIIDFGMACSIEKKSIHYCSSFGGTPDYMSPQMLFFIHFGVSSIDTAIMSFLANDVYAMGVCFYQMLTKSLGTPYDDIDVQIGKKEGTIQNILKYNEIGDCSNAAICSFVKSMVDPDDSKRPTAEEAVSILNDIEYEKPTGYRRISKSHNSDIISIITDVIKKGSFKSSSSESKSGTESLGTEEY